ncbi:hypothetical protein GWK47_014274 [Chionoecetes opilio]|uniref:Uncharacterized protein n=1 Tax=Chionoecetes opilio TaxID=41210 RepID=A0A8J4XT84_CHIOP|nr:hypothetical protein GWK47_014274 [Chionoecetes opilio]
MFDIAHSKQIGAKIPEKQGILEVRGRTAELLEAGVGREAEGEGTEGEASKETRMEMKKKDAAACHPILIVDGFGAF